jgi:hypothetical protein
VRDLRDHPTAGRDLLEMPYVVPVPCSVIRTFLTLGSEQCASPDRPNSATWRPPPHTGRRSHRPDPGATHAPRPRRAAAPSAAAVAAAAHRRPARRADRDRAMPIRAGQPRRPPPRTHHHHGGPVRQVNSVNARALVRRLGQRCSRPESRARRCSPLLRGIGRTPYWNYDSTYTDKTGARIANKVARRPDHRRALAGQAHRRERETLVSNAITRGGEDATASTRPHAKDVTETNSFLTKYCGWHPRPPADIKYSSSATRRRRTRTAPADRRPTVRRTPE